MLQLCCIGSVVLLCSSIDLLSQLLLCFYTSGFRKIIILGADISGLLFVG